MKNIDLLLLGALISTLYSEGSLLPKPGECGRKYLDVGRIAGGTNAKLGEFPWAALLGYKKFDGSNDYDYLCGGTLINSRYVLTAAHCHSGTFKISIVVLGEFNTDINPDCPEYCQDSKKCTGRKKCQPPIQTIGVERVIMHEDYYHTLSTGDIHVSDIALVRMRREAIYNTAVQPICLPLNEEETAYDIGIDDLNVGLIGRNVTIIGWAANETGPINNILQKVDFPIVPTNNCKSQLTEKIKIGPAVNLNIGINNICAGAPGKDSCDGDSGGGMFIQKPFLENNLTRIDYITQYQIGITSYGYYRCGTDLPAVYTRVSKFIPWIKRSINNTENTLIRPTTKSTNTTTIATSSRNTDFCPVGWTSLITGCYQFVQAGSFPEASAICNNKGGFLVEIDNQEEQDALAQFHEDSNVRTYVYLGGTDENREGQWMGKHSGKEIMKFDGWLTGNPSGGLQENCVYTSHYYKFKWNDIACSWKRGGMALCEFQNGTETTDLGLLGGSETGLWEPWSTWSSCTKTCGSGFKHRIRKCQDTQCQGEQRTDSRCNDHSCDLDISSFDGNSLAQTVKRCRNDEVCTIRENCPRIEAKYIRLQSVGKKGSRWKRIIRNLKDSVCNRKEKGFCCKIKQSSGELPKSTSSVLPHVPLLPGTQDGTYLPRPDNCGVNPIKHKRRKHRAIGGQTTTIGDFPFSALLGYTVIKREYNQLKGKYENRTTIKYKCGGTLINHWYVLTAAQCQGTKPSKRIAQVVLGEWQVGEDPDCTVDGKCFPKTQMFDIDEGNVIVHEGYEFLKTVLPNKTLKYVINDIALVRLNKPAVMNEGVRMACLTFDQEEATRILGVSDLESGLNGHIATMTSWGHIGYDPLVGANQGDYSTLGVGSKFQQQLNLPLLTPSQCRQKYYPLEVKDGQVCAGGEVGKDSCNRDAGAGLLLSGWRADEDSMPWYLIGMVSFGSKQCGGGKPTVFTRVSHYIQWIKQNLRP